MKWVEVSTQAQLDALKPGEAAIVRAGFFTAYGSATVTAYDSATVTAYDSATVRATGSATVTAYDSATVRATEYVAVHHLSQRASVTGGVIIRPKTDTPADWCDFYGVDVKRGMAVLYKAVEDDWQGTHKRGITYRPGDKPKAPDFSPVAECGGGLHLSPRPFMARTYCQDATHFVACKVRVADLILLGDKVKVPGCTVLHEVDEDGEAL